jgi:hypothetical protein
METDKVQTEDQPRVETFSIDEGPPPQGNLLKQRHVQMQVSNCLVLPSLTFPFSNRIAVRSFAAESFRNLVISSRLLERWVQACSWDPERPYGVPALLEL